MNKEQYINIFKSLINQSESEVVEFKRAENNFDIDDLGKYFSALSNEGHKPYLRCIYKNRLMEMLKFRQRV